MIARITDSWRESIPSRGSWVHCCASKTTSGNCSIAICKQAEEENIRQLDELLRWQALMLGREDRNMELKREVNELLRRLGEPIRYPSQEGEGEP